MCHELSREWATASCSPSHSYTWQAKICSSLIVHGFCLIPRLCFFPSPHEIERWGPIFCYWPHIHCSFLLIDLSYCVHRVPSVWRMNSLYDFSPHSALLFPAHSPSFIWQHVYFTPASEGCMVLDIKPWIGSGWIQHSEDAILVSPDHCFL